MTAERIAAMPDDDWRKHDPRFQEPELSRHLALVARLQEVAERHDTTAGAIAVAWTLHHPAVHGSIVGFRRPDQVEALAVAANVELTDEDLATIDAPVARCPSVRLLAVISDTHLPRGARALPEACVERLRAADLDPARGRPRHRRGARRPARARAARSRRCTATSTTTRSAPAALGPDGGRPGRRASRWSTTAGPAAGRLARLRQRFASADADAVVFGHSHIPLHERDPATGFQIFNPGSPTDRRRQPTHTMGQARIGEDGAVSFELIDLG